MGQSWSEWQPLARDGAGGRGAGAGAGPPPPPPRWSQQGWSSAHWQNPSTEQSGWEDGQSWLEEHLPLHLGQAKVERKKEERRKAVSKVLI